MILSSSSFAKKQIFFDLDDTLVDDGYKFELTSCDCAKAIIQAFETRSPAIDEIIDQFRKTDNDRLKNVPPEERFLPSRLSGSWHDSYDALCEKYGIAAKRATHMLLEGYVLQNFEPPYYIVPDSLEALLELMKTGKYELRVLSSGDPVVQRKKLEVTDLNKYFASVHFFPDGNKTPALEEAAKEFGPHNVWMIGNSIAFDVNAGLRVGVNAIHIPRGSWHASIAEPLNRHYVETDNINKVPAILERWRRRGE